MASMSRRLVAEALGTFALVFIGTGAVIMNGFPNAGYGLLGIAVAHAFVYSVMVTATMNISGGHLNPAVTFGVLIARKIDAKTAAAYIGAQLVAAVVASLLVKGILPANVGRVVAFGTPLIASTVTLPQAVGVEAILTFFLVSAVFGTVVSADGPKVGGFGVGLVLLFAMLVGGPLTGAALNPARAFGPAMISGNLTGHIAYWIGPLLGGLLAGGLWGWLLSSRRETA